MNSRRNLKAIETESDTFFSLTSNLYGYIITVPQW